VAIVYVCLYFIMPDGMSGGLFISPRLQLYPFLALMLWLAAHPNVQHIWRGIQLVAAGVAVILLGFHGMTYVELNDYLKEYLSGIHLIAPNATLLPISFSHQGHTPDGRVLALRIGPFLHAGGYIAAQGGVIDLLNYSADSDQCSYFPLRFRPELNPFRHIAPKVNGQAGAEPQSHPLELQPPPVDFLTYPQRTGGRVDYVLVWRIRDEYYDHPYTKSIFQQLEQGYERIHTSPQRGFMQLYRRKGWGT
jgi:hypothetical protein